MAVTMAVLSVAGVRAQLLYRITGRELGRPSYIFATHHAVPVSALGDVDGVFRAYNDCEAVVGEIVMDDDSVGVRMAEEAKMTANVAELLTKEDYLFVDSVLTAVTGIRLSMVAHLRPAMIENIYSLTMYERLFPQEDDDTQMDSFFQRTAALQGKPVYGLESVDDQLQLLFHAQTVQQQARQLVNTMRRAESLPDDIKRLNRLYLTGNLDSLYAWSVSVEAMTPDDYERLVGDRNRKWIERIVPFIRDKSCFIAVGALHLPGEEGLIRLLERKGYKVRAVQGERPKTKD